MPNTDGDTHITRTTRSNSTQNNTQISQPITSDHVSKDDFKSFKDDIVSLFKSEFTKITNAFERLEDRIDQFETAMTVIRTEQLRQASEIKDLKKRLEKVDSVDSVDLISEIEDRLRRKCNVIVASVDELRSGRLSERREHDDQRLTEIFQEL